MGERSGRTNRHRPFAAVQQRQRVLRVGSGGPASVAAAAGGARATAAAGRAVVDAAAHDAAADACDATSGHPAAGLGQAGHVDVRVELRLAVGRRRVDAARRAGRARVPLDAAARGRAAAGGGGVGAVRRRRGLRGSAARVARVLGGARGAGPGARAVTALGGLSARRVPRRARGAARARAALHVARQPLIVKAAVHRLLSRRSAAAALPETRVHPFI